METRKGSGRNPTQLAHVKSWGGLTGKGVTTLRRKGQEEIYGILRREIEGKTHSWCGLDERSRGDDTRLGESARTTTRREGRSHDHPGGGKS